MRAWFKAFRCQTSFTKSSYNEDDYVSHTIILYNAAKYDAVLKKTHSRTFQHTELIWDTPILCIYGAAISWENALHNINGADAVAIEHQDINIHDIIWIRIF